MKAILAIFLLSLISGSLAFYNVKKVPPTIIDTSFLKNVNSAKKRTFGGLTALMQQLEDTSDVQTFLAGLLDDLAAARQQKLAIIEQTRAQCSDEEEFRDEAITEGQRGADAAQNQLNLCSSQRDQANHLRDLAASALEVYQNDLEELNAARDEQRSTYETRIAKLGNARDAIAQLQAFLDEFEVEANSPLGSTQFLQTANGLLRHSISTGHSHLVLPVYTKLLQVHAKQTYNEDDLTELRQALNAMDQAAADSTESLNEKEASDQQAYDDESARLNGLITRLSNQVAVTEQFSATMDQCIAQETSILDLSNDKVSRNTDLLAVSQQLCSAAEDEWRLSELNRSREVNIITALQAAVNRIESDYESDTLPQVSDIVQLRML